MKTPTMHKRLHELHQQYNKHTMVPIWSSNCLHICTGCGYWFEQMSPGSFIPVGVKTFAAHGGRFRVASVLSSEAYLTERGAKCRLRRLAAYLQSLGYANNPTDRTGPTEAAALKKALTYGLKQKAV